MGKRDRRIVRMSCPISFTIGNRNHKSNY